MARTNFKSGLYLAILEALLEGPLLTYFPHISGRISGQFLLAEVSKESVA